METKFKSLQMPVDLIKQVEAYQKENYISSFTQAVIQLLFKALESEK